MAGKSPSSIPTKGKDVFPFDFFTALNNGDDDTAIDELRREALPDGEVPSPRAEALIKSGEWDSNQKVSLVFIEANACAGRIGNDEYRFCGKSANYCTVGIHTKVTVGSIKRGWYISCMGKSQGLLTTPFLSAMEDGGPIRPTGAGRLADGDNPFRLTRGQWKFIIDAWHASMVEALSDDSSISKEEIQLSATPTARDPNTDLTIVVGDDELVTEQYGSGATLDTNGMDDGSKGRGKLSNTEQIRQLEQQVFDLILVNQRQQATYNLRLKEMEESFTDRVQRLDYERTVLVPLYDLFSGGIGFGSYRRKW
jgi:hypothetical protein